MTLQAVYEDPTQIPEQFTELYTEKGGKYELTGIAGVKTAADVDRLSQALANERNEHKKAKAHAGQWGELDHTEVLANLSELDELRAKVEAGAANQFDEEKFGKAVDARVATLTNPLKRDLEKFTSSNAELQARVEAYEMADRTRSIHDSVRKAATDSKVIPSAVDDVLMLAERMFEITDDGMVVAKDAVGVTPGIDPATWMAEMQEKRPHWWPTSVGGGANGSGNSSGGFAKNPWSAENWNMTEQGQVYRADPAKADRMAKAAGSKIGGQKPTK